jgi:hypothetical protein
MRRAGLFLLLVAGWSILFMAKDRNGWSDKLPANQALAMSMQCIPMTEEECIVTGGSYDSTSCCCEYFDPGCNPAEAAVCESDPLCTWDDVFCECNCQECGPPQEFLVDTDFSPPYTICVDGVLKTCESRTDYYETIDCHEDVISSRQEVTETCTF